MPTFAQPTEHWSSLSWRPLAASEESRLEVVGLVVSLTEPKASVSVLRVRVTARCTVSPGTRLVAATVVPAVACWVRPMTTLPLVTVWLAEVVEVKAPKVPRPATEAAPATRATEARILAVLRRRGVECLAMTMVPFGGTAGGSGAVGSG